MAITTITVTGPILDSNGQPYENGKLYLKPEYRMSDVDEGATLAQSAVVVIPDENGDFTVDLAPSGAVVFAASVSVSRDNNIQSYALGNFLVPETGPASLQELLDDFAPPADPFPTVTEVTEARDEMQDALYSISNLITRIQDFGGVGDGVTDDTAALQAAAASGKIVYFGAGTYMTNGESYFSTAGTHWFLDAGATIKLSAAPDDEFEMIRLIASHCSITGRGTLDGSRDTLTFPYEAPAVRGIVSRGAENVHVDGITIKNFVLHGIYHGTGDYPIYENIHIIECGRAMGVQGNSTKPCLSPTVRNIIAERIGNDGKFVYQHCFSNRDFTGGVFEDIRILDYQPDEHGREPNPNGFAIERASGFRVVGLYIDTFSGSSPTGRWKGFKIDGCSSFEINVSGVIGYPQGMLVKACRDGVIRINKFDGQYIDMDNGDGLTFGNGALAKNTFAGSIAQNSRSIGISENISVYGGTITGFKNGVVGAMSNVKFYGLDSYGNVQDNWRFTEELIAGDYDPDNTQEVIAPQVSRNVELFGCSGRFAGRAGAYIVSAHGLTFHGGEWSNNGQDTTQSNNHRNGFLAVGGDGNRSNIRVIGSDCRDTQDWTQVAGGSFIPGSVDSDNRLPIALLNPERYTRGQKLIFKNLVGSDVTGWVYEKTSDDFITVQFDSAITPVDTGNLNALTGLVYGTEGEATITGVGTAFDTEISGRVYVKIASDYYLVRGVQSANDITISEPLPADVSGETAYLVQVDIESIPSQQYAIYEDDLADGSITFAGIQHDGCVTGTARINTVDYEGSTSTLVNAYDVQKNGLTVWSDTKLTDYTPTVSDAETGGNVATIEFNRCGHINIGPLTQVTYELVNIDTTGMTGTNEIWIDIPYETNAGAANKFTGGSCMVHYCNYPYPVTPAIRNGDRSLRLGRSMTDGFAEYMTVDQLISGQANIILTIMYLRKLT